MPNASFNQWSTIEPFIDNTLLPDWAPDDDDKLRLAAYSMYEQIWRNIPHAFELVQRGTDEDPIYIPSAKKCIEATNRYLGRGFKYRLDGGVANDRNSADLALQTLFRREKFHSKLASLKRMSLVRGDAIWYIKADPNKPAGRRISLYELDPTKYHPIYDVNDAEKLLGVHIVEPYIDPKNKSKSLVRRQTFRRLPNTAGPDTITSEEAIFEADGWDDRQLVLNPDYKMKPYQNITSPFNLPPQITALPIYHVANQYESSLQFGTSDLAGFERLIAGINQAITDEELSLALDGLGVYFSTAPRPSTGWLIGPGTVIDADQGQSFERVNGVGTVQPSQDHLAYLGGELKQAMGTPDIAIGNVDVQIAQSGIALALQMGPILTRNSEKEDQLLAVHDHLLYDLINGWLPAYEQLAISPVAAAPSFDDPMPKDEDAIIDRVIKLMGTTPPLISAEYGRLLLAEKLGYEFPDDMGANVLQEIEANAKAQMFDPFTLRVAEELNAAQGAEGVPINANGAGAG